MRITYVHSHRLKSTFDWPIDIYLLMKINNPNNVHPP